MRRRGREGAGAGVRPGTLEVLVAAEQLRRRVPGGIGTYARGLLQGLHEIERDARGTGVRACAVTLLASRRPRPARAADGAAGDAAAPEGSAREALGAGASADDAPAATADPLAVLGWPVRAHWLPGRLLTRAWDHGWAGVPDGYDVVHSVSLAAPPVSATGPLGLPTRSTVTVHDLAWRQNPESTTRRGARWHEAALQRALRHADALVVPSQPVRDELLALGTAPDRVVIVTGGTDHLAPPDTAAASALLASLGVSGEYLLTVGTLEPRKNLPRLVSAYEFVRRQLPEPWPLVVVGPQGWGDVTPGGAGIHLAGAVTDGVLSGLYAGCRLFAYVPLTEGYGLPPMEAMTFGVPVVASSGVPSVRGAPGTPDSACIVDPFDVESMAHGLYQASVDPDLRATLSQRGQATARSRTWAATARQHLRLWESFL